MNLVYNILQLLALLILGPMLALWAVIVPKYRGRVLRRLGWGLSGLAQGLPTGPTRVWVHALSVGEAASARPLLRALRRELPEVIIILSTATRGGEEYARRELADDFDCLLASPLDIHWVVARFVARLRPDLFVLVETDFWPNLLATLARRGVPALLVNGRITEQSLSWYGRFRFLFVPLFNGFAKITMQMAADARRLVELGVDEGRIAVVGNLKYDLAPPTASVLDPADLGLRGRPLLVAGSTHPGEETPLLAAFTALTRRWPHLALVLAPREVARGREIAALAQGHGLNAARRTEGGAVNCQVLVLDTIGELASLYRLADLAVVGGSLVPAGGHNPLEPAIFGKPVLFGPDMRDFAEIAAEMLAAGAARLTTPETLTESLAALLADEGQRRDMGERGRRLVLAHQGAAARHLALIREVLRHGR